MFFFYGHFIILFIHNIINYFYEIVILNVSLMLVIKSLLALLFVCTVSQVSQLIYFFKHIQYKANT